MIALVVGLALPTLLYPLGRDQGMYANIGAAILRGGLPYVDMWDIKPPPIYYLYALSMALFGQTPLGVRMLDLLLVPLGMWGLMLLGARIAGERVGQWAALLYGVFYFSDQFANLAQSDSLVTVFMIWAALASWQAATATPGGRAALGYAAACGALCGVIVWFKQYQAFFVAALVLWQIVQRWGQRRALVREAVAFTLGGVLTGGGLLIYFAAIGIIPEMLIVAQSTSAYNAQYSDWGAFFSQMGNYFTFRWWYWGALFVLVGLAALLSAAGKLRGRRWGFVWGWLAAATAFMVVQRLGFDTHWFPMLPPMALLGAAAVWWVSGGASEASPLNPLSRGEGWGDCALARAVALNPLSRGEGTSAAVPSGGRRQATSSRGVGSEAFQALIRVAFILTFGGILAYNTWWPAWGYLTGQQTQHDYYAQFQANDLKPEQSLAVVEWLRPRLAAGDTLYVWGFRPEVAFMGGWRPATRWQAQFPLVAPWYPLEWQQQNVDLLWAAMPPYALILTDDFMPWVTGRHEDSHTILQGYTELNNWLMANYDRVHTIGDFLIWQRKPRT
jgi:4-amino-4-deoxy-L-arabinose transferase-like glycosyltransferase